MTPLVFQVPGDPHAQGRARMRVIQTKGRAFASAYDPKESRDWKATVSQIMGDALRDRYRDTEPVANADGAKHADGYPFPLDAVLDVAVFALFPCPKGDHRKIPVPRRWCGKAKDADNIAKAIMDAGNGVLYPDDRAIAHLDAWKIIAAQGEPPRTIVSIRQLGEDDLVDALHRMELILSTGANRKAEG